MAVERREATVQGRRILVIANETLIGTVLHEAIRFRARNVGGEVLVVAPVLDTATPEWTTDSDGARRSRGAAPFPVAGPVAGRGRQRPRPDRRPRPAPGDRGRPRPLRRRRDHHRHAPRPALELARARPRRAGPRPLRPARPARRRRPRAPARARGRHDPPRRPPPPPAAADADAEPHADPHRELRASAMSRRPRIPACPPRRFTSCAAASGRPVFRRVAPPRAPRHRPERRPPAAHGGWRRPR